MDGHELHPLAELMRRYAFAYTAVHDFEVCRQIMVDDYVLRMGPHVIRGREEAYIPATERQYRQFPGLGFTVHDFLQNGDRCALRFSEHGRSVRRGTDAVWLGISLYRWDGTRLVECRVEQDYFSRRRQLAAGRPEPLPPPAVDPWTVPPGPTEAEAELTVRTWLEKTGLDGAVVVLDDEPWADPCRARLDLERVEVDDLFSAGGRVAFHAGLHGRYTGGLPGLDDHAGRPAVLYAAGITEVESGRITAVRAVTDRLGLERQLNAT